MKKKIISLLLTAAMTVSLLAGCGNSNNSMSTSGDAQNGTATQGGAQNNASTLSGNASSDTGSASGEAVTIKLFSNLPDRKNGQGLVEQMIIDEYMAANQNVTIEVEALDEEAYKTKFKAYAMDGMPDVVSIWGQPSFLDEVLDAGVLAELNEADYADYDFIAGSLEGFKKDGKLYGLPRNTDIMLIYYNQKMFEDNGWAVPDTYDELMTLCSDIRAAGITPIAMDGGDGWPMACFLTDILVKVAGTDYAEIVRNAVATGDFTAPELQEATQILVDSAAAGMFQVGYDSQDYGTTMNLFTNGQAAMYCMGSWDCSMALNEDIAPEIRDNIRAFTMPVVEGGKGCANDIAAWNGGGYAVSAGSAVREEAIKFLNYMYQPDKLSKYGWENGVGMSAQDQTAYLTGNETELQKQVMDILKNATSVSGTPINDCGPSAFKTSIESEIQGVSNGSVTVEDFLAAIGAACE
ncbi:MAG: extracellular solute-binding protein [Lachnospiraceae bacterium]|nr:extracellular solute-binding protein [Lachnospiraceae bacterium]